MAALLQDAMACWELGVPALVAASAANGVSRVLRMLPVNSTGTCQAGKRFDPLRQGQRGSG